MFEIGFTEILVITVLALVVLGPEKLPRVAAQVGRWLGKARAMARQFREQLEDEVQLADVNKAKATAAASAAAAGASSTGTTPDGTAAAADPASPAADPGPPMYSDIHDAAASHTAGTSSDASSALPPEVAAANAAAETAHSDANGPPPEPEAAEYQPPLYSQVAATPGASETHMGGNGVESPSHHDDPPLKAGDFITHTHERGI
ncbi:MAG TPA: Sec-independent protein translocase protein TatB [Steroidobacteraceae bacterium]|jgi:sec-independent protein translocase protein TatB|nr:Sec-independent protein translocase protein TatB [Steroidobacteraceae bacterium]